MSHYIIYHLRGAIFEQPKKEKMYSQRSQPSRSLSNSQTEVKKENIKKNEKKSLDSSFIHVGRL